MVYVCAAPPSNQYVNGGGPYSEDRPQCRDAPPQSPYSEGRPQWRDAPPQSTYRENGSSPGHRSLPAPRLPQHSMAGLTPTETEFLRNVAPSAAALNGSRAQQPAPEPAPKDNLGAASRRETASFAASSRSSRSSSSGSGISPSASASAGAGPPGAYTPAQPQQAPLAAAGAPSREAATVTSQRAGHAERAALREEAREATRVDREFQRELQPWERELHPPEPYKPARIRRGRRRVKRSLSRP